MLRDRTDENGGALAFLRLFSGGALTQFAIFALGILPYITASIIMQILGVVIPRVEQWQQMGAVGQRKITQTTRYMTIGIALLQSTAFAFLFHNGGGGFGGTSGDGTSLDLLPNFTAPRVAPIVRNTAIAAPLSFTSMIRDEIMLKAATRMISVRMRNMTFRSTCNALKKLEFLCFQSR